MLLTVINKDINRMGKKGKKRNNVFLRTEFVINKLKRMNMTRTEFAEQIGVKSHNTMSVYINRYYGIPEHIRKNIMSFFPENTFDELFEILE